MNNSGLIEPLGARKNLTKPAFTLRCRKPPTKAGRTGQPELAEPPSSGVQVDPLVSKPILLHGDCLEIMGHIPAQSVDMILADPPYGTTACKWDSIIPLEPMWEQLKRVIKPNGAIVLTASQPFTTKLINSNILNFKHELIWFKNVPTGMAQAAYAPMKYHENIIVFCNGRIGTFNKQMEDREGKGKNCYNYAHYCGESNHVKMQKVKLFYDVKLVNPSSVVLFNSAPNRKDKLHPTQKPVALMEYLIKTYSNQGETVLDFTMGSGTTGVACKKLGRNFIGIELDETYYQIATKRIEAC